MKSLVRERGLEPLYLTVPDPKSGASANFATLAGGINKQTPLARGLILIGVDSGDRTHV
jgi:hypothetical protein